MAIQTLPSGGKVYYGNSNSSIDPNSADFSTGMAALTGTTGHITVSYVAPVITIKYDWMTTGHIAQIHHTTGTEGFAYTIYVSDYGDVFARFQVSDSPCESPWYDSYPNDDVYTWNNATSGTTDVITTNLSIFKLNSTDVRSTSERFIFGIPASSGVILYPDSVVSGSTSGLSDAAINFPTYTDAKFTVLGPIYSSKSSGVTTYARRFDGITQSYAASIAGGAYTIGGYRYQVINNGQRSPIALANSDS